jgi:hypothetical protein
MRQGEERDQRDEGVFETVNGFMIPRLENVEEGTLLGRLWG